MDAGEYDTNTLLIACLTSNNLASIAYRIYEPVVLQNQPYTFAASDVEDALRRDGHLVYMDAVRRGIWCFYLLARGASSPTQPNRQPEQWGLPAVMEVCGFRLGLVDEGGFEPISLFKTRSSPASSTAALSSSTSTGSMDMPVRGAQPHGSPVTPTANAPMSATDRTRMPKPDFKGYSLVPVKEVHDFFITAVLGSLSNSFCRQTKAIPLDHRTVLLPPSIFHPLDGSPGSSVAALPLASFRIYLTTTGSLVISLRVSLARGLSMAESVLPHFSSPGVFVLAAPLGAIGLSGGIVNEADNRPIDGPGCSPEASNKYTSLPNTENMLVLWKQHCSKVIQMSGISPSFLDGSSWLNIRFLEQKTPTPRGDAKALEPPALGPTAPWPAVLCFRKSSTPGMMEDGARQTSQAISSQNFDPLSSAKAWFLGLSGRDETMAKRKKEREAAQSRVATEADGRAHPPTGYSPFALRPVSNGGVAPTAAAAAAAAAAAGAMYPTPPDGPSIAQPQPATTSSPATENQALASSSVAGGDQQPTTRNTDALLGDGFNEATWTGHGDGVKREQHNPTFIASENLYGDLGEDMFGHELTDADFNFYDQPSQELNANLDLLGDDDMDTALDMSSGMLQPKSNTSEGAASNFQSRPAGPGSQGPVKRPDSAEFTKPELKHARSTLGEENSRRQKINMESFAQNSLVPLKRHPSPFNSDTVYKRIRALFADSSGLAGAHANPTSPARRTGVFERIEFDPSLALVNKKYQVNGIFDCEVPAPRPKERRLFPSRDYNASLSTSGFIPARRQRPNLKSLPSNSGVLARILGLNDNSSQHLVKGSVDEVSGSDSDVASLVSEDGTGQSEDEPPSPAKSGAAISLRKRSDNEDAMSTAGSLTFKEQALLGNVTSGATALASSPNYMAIDLSRLAHPMTPELSVTKWFAEPEPAPLKLTFSSDEDLIMVAQILTEQAATGSLCIFGSQAARCRQQQPPPPPPQHQNCDSGDDKAEPVQTYPSSELHQTQQSLARAVRLSMIGLRRALPRTLAGAVDCQFRTILEVQDVTLLGQPMRMPPNRPGPGQMPEGSKIPFQIPAPHLHLRRYDNLLSILPSAIPFWETLGLAPYSGPKDIVSVCVFPDREGIRDSAIAFLARIRSVFESLKLGTFEPLPPANGVVDGLLACGAPDQPKFAPSSSSPNAASPVALAPVGSSLADQMLRLSQALVVSNLSAKNVVVYFAYISDAVGSILDCCCAFQELFDLYRRAKLERKSASSAGDGIELVLQLVPLDAMASESTLVVLSPPEYTKLCLETYDRCTIFTGNAQGAQQSTLPPAPSVVLEVYLPRAVEFKVQPSPSWNVLLENSYLHLAYAQSTDERWIAAAWTDNSGKQQMTASYCLGRRHNQGLMSRGKLATPFADVAREMWLTTLNLMSSAKIHWRVMVTKCGTMDQDEMQTWIRTAQSAPFQPFRDAGEPITGGRTNAASLALLAVDTSPSLQLVPPAAKIPPLAAHMVSAMYTSPASTPQPSGSTVSPEQSGNNPGTPTMNASAPVVTTPGGTGGEANVNVAGGGDPDADSYATLVDVADNTWGAISAHRLNNSASLTELRPALASGYLVRHGGGGSGRAAGFGSGIGSSAVLEPSTMAPAAIMEVNLLHCEYSPNPRMYDFSLRDVLFFYRSLNTLARARGVVDSVAGDVRPWHIAAAEKAVQALYQLM